MIIASLTDVGEGAKTNNHLFLAEAPFPGDTISVHSTNQVLRVIRRRWIDHARFDAPRGLPGCWVDIDLDVRLESQDQKENT